MKSLKNLHRTVSRWWVITPIGGQDNTNPLAQPEADMNVKTSPSSSISRFSS
ncbi:unnamed protein product [Brassica oleracea var. botrytis]|uniref:(rape) hypothetical protein n=1 Tax=Brassica napus TaxID=3708 RepID=A0A816IQ58_BRANA|nr:unnamed protein product [Brassica napus]